MTNTVRAALVLVLTVAVLFAVAGVAQAVQKSFETNGQKITKNSDTHWEVKIERTVGGKTTKVLYKCKTKDIYDFLCGIAGTNKDVTIIHDGDVITGYVANAKRPK